MIPAVLVTGATGKQGGATARSLVVSGAQVHALVRSPSSAAAVDLQSQGVIIHIGSYDDPISLSAAFSHNVTAVFMNTSPSSVPGLEIQHATNIVSAAVKAGTVESIVYPSIVQTGNHETFPGWSSWDPNSFMVQYWLSKHIIETMVRASGIKHWTILRPLTFMSNYHSPSLRWFFPEVLTQHVFRTALSFSTKTMLIAPEHIGACAAAVFMAPEIYHGREIDIGAEALTPDEISAALTRVSGEKITPVQIPKEEVDRAVMGGNMTIVSQLFFNERSASIDTRKVKETFPGIDLRRFEDYLRSKEQTVRSSIE